MRGVKKTWDFKTASIAYYAKSKIAKSSQAEFPPAVCSTILSFLPTEDDVFNTMASSRQFYNFEVGEEGCINANMKLCYLDHDQKSTKLMKAMRVITIVDNNSKKANKIDGWEPFDASEFEKSLKKWFPNLKTIWMDCEYCGGCCKICDYGGYVNYDLDTDYDMLCCSDCNDRIFAKEMARRKPKRTVESSDDSSDESDED
jgi:hypothetical protein